MLRSRIPEIVIELEVVIHEVIQKGAERVKESAQGRVPVRTGALRDEIHTLEEPNRAYVIAGSSRVFYGHFVEHGTTKAPPRPFLVPALAENEPLILSEARLRMSAL